MLDPVGDLRRLRERSDWLLTVLTAVLSLVLFVFAPLQASGISVFHGFAIGGLLAIIGSMVFISDSPTALVLMSIALIANLAVFFLRLYYPLAFHLHITGRRMVDHLDHSQDSWSLRPCSSEAASRTTELSERSLCTC